MSKSNRKTIVRKGDISPENEILETKSVKGKTRKLKDREEKKLKNTSKKMDKSGEKSNTVSKTKVRGKSKIAKEKTKRIDKKDKPDKTKIKEKTSKKDRGKTDKEKTPKLSKGAKSPETKKIKKREDKEKIGSDDDRIETTADTKNEDTPLEEENEDFHKNRILEVTTTQTAAIKQVIERISNIISDCCIVFIPLEADEEEENEKGEDNKKSGGIRILRLKEDGTILIKLKLYASKFDKYYCEEPKIVIGVDMHNFHSLLKMVSDKYPITLYINRDTRSILHIKSLNRNSESNEETDIELYLMEISNTEINLPKTDFQNMIRMDYDKFHTICKNLNNNSTSVEITSINNEILFRGQNEGGKVTMTYRDNEKIKKKSDNGQVVQGVYDLKNLMCFSKCNKLCPDIQIYLKNDFPLVLAISVASLGKLYVFISPRDKDVN